MVCGSFGLYPSIFGPSLVHVWVWVLRLVSLRYVLANRNSWRWAFTMHKCPSGFFGRTQTPVPSPVLVLVVSLALRRR